MPVKRGAGGKLQNYDSHGRYAKTNYSFLYEVKPSRKEKARRKEEARRDALYHRAKNSKDPYLLEVFLAIEKEMPGEVTGVNEIRFDPNIGHPREFDILTKKCIIEVKGKQVRRKLTQLLQQKEYAISKGKNHIVFAPNILFPCKNDYENHGIKITTSISDMLKEIKEGKK